MGIAGFGAYGKIPALGDFLQAGLAPGFIAPWDRWLQAGLMAARQSLGERWQGCYLSAPIWRFTLAAGVAGPQAVLGVMMPSVDRVGRQFPLTLAALLPAPPPPHEGVEHIFTALEDVALDALEFLPRDALLARLALVAAPGTGQGGTLWATGPLDGARQLPSPGLPDAGQMPLMFDMEAPDWALPTKGVAPA